MRLFSLHQGSNIKFTVQGTPPYSLFNNINYKIATPEAALPFC